LFDGATAKPPAELTTTVVAAEVVCTVKVVGKSPSWNDKLPAPSATRISPAAPIPEGKVRERKVTLPVPAGKILMLMLLEAPVAPRVTVLVAEPPRDNACQVVLLLPAPTLISRARLPLVSRILFICGFTKYELVIVELVTNEEYMLEVLMVALVTIGLYRYEVLMVAPVRVEVLIIAVLRVEVLIVAEVIVPPLIALPVIVAPLTVTVLIAPPV